MKMLCQCGHIQGVHAHYRQGFDCALCGCDAYRTRSWWPVVLVVLAVLLFIALVVFSLGLLSGMESGA